MIVDTANLFPEGEYVFTVSDVPAQEQRAGYVFWTFHFTTEIDEAPVEYGEAIPIWLSAPMFRALGFKEIRPGRFDVDPPAALGRRIKGRIVHETLESGKRAGSPVARLKDITPAPGNGQAAADFQAPLPSLPASAVNHPLEAKTTIDEEGIPF